MSYRRRTDLDLSPPRAHSLVMSALAHVFTPAPLRYRDVELTALSFAGEVRYHDRTGALAFRVTEVEVAGLARLAATAGRAGVMLFLFFKIVAGGGDVLSAETIAREIGGATTRDVERLVAALVLAGLVRREAVKGGFRVRFPGAAQNAPVSASPLDPVLGSIDGTT